MPLDCTPPTDTVDESGDVLQALVALDPSAYVLVDRGPCECCDVCDYDYAELPETICLTITETVPPTGVIVGPAVMTRTGPDGGGTYTYTYSDGVRFNIQLHVHPLCNVTYSIVDVSPQCYDCAECGFDILHMVAGEPLYFERNFTSSSNPECDGNTITIVFCENPDCPDGECTVPDPPDPPGAWWCVEIVGPPYRDCVQGATEAVGGPYASEADCLDDVDCLPCNFYCVEYQDHDADHADVGPPYFECVALTGVTVGQVDHPLAGGSADHRTRTVKDGPFTAANCVCPPCAGGGEAVEGVVCDEPDGGEMMMMLGATAALTTGRTAAVSYTAPAPKKAAKAIPLELRPRAGGKAP